MKEENKTMKASELIKKLVDLIGETGDADVIIDYDCRRITGVHHDESDSEYSYYGWFEIETEEEENHRKYYSTLGWRRIRDGHHYENVCIDEYDNGRLVLCYGDHEIDIDTLLKLPKED